MINRTLFVFIVFFAVTPGFLLAQKTTHKDCEIQEDDLIEESFLKSAALLIGNSNYTNGWRTLPSVSEDVDNLSEVLCKKGFEVVVHKDLTASEIQDAVTDFIAKYGYEQHNRLLFYTSGHGHSVSRTTGISTDYFAGIDAPLASTNRVVFEQKSIDLNFYQSLARKIEAKHVMFVFDACFAGNIFKHTVQSDPAYGTAVQFTANPIRFFITSGGEGQAVSPGSFFVRKLIEALTTTKADFSADYLLTGKELGFFLETQLRTYTGGTQVPLYGAITEDLLDDGEFFFSLISFKEIDDKIKQLSKEELQIQIAKLEKEAWRLRQVLKSIDLNINSLEEILNTFNQVKVKYVEQSKPNAGFDKKGIVVALEDANFIEVENEPRDLVNADLKRTYKTSEFKYFPNPLNLNEGNSVKIFWGETSDLINANQPVYPVLISALQSTLSLANQYLKRKNLETISSIKIFSTTNGNHSPYSNHVRGTAFDISEINEKLISNVRILDDPSSETLKSLKEEQLNKLKVLKIQMYAIQLAWDYYPRSRENFGPLLQHKYILEREEFHYMGNLSRLHQSHIHLSVR